MADPFDLTITKSQANNPLLSFQASVGQSYKISRLSNLEDSFSTAVPLHCLEASASQSSYEDLNPPPGQAFYRVDAISRPGPLSLDGVRLDFAALSGPSLTFASYRGARGLVGNEEFGTVLAYSGGGGSFQYESDGQVFDAAWPQTLSKASYSFFPVGEFSGLLSISVSEASATSTPSVFEGSSISPVTFMLIFTLSNDGCLVANVSGSVTPAANSTLAGSLIIMDGASAPTVSIAQTANPVPVGYTTDPNTPSALLPANYDNTILSLEESSGTFGDLLIICNSQSSSPISPIVDEGSAVVFLLTQNQMRPQSSYQATHLPGTDEATFSLTFPTGQPAISLNLTFDGLNYGTYSGQDTLGATSEGTFSLDLN